MVDPVQVRPTQAAPARRHWLLVGLVAALCLLLAGAGAGAALEEQTVGNFGSGLMWAVTLMTTAGFINGPPETGGGNVTAVVLMVSGFLLLSLASAALAAVFVRDDVEQAAESSPEDEILRHLRDIDRRLAALEDSLARNLPPSEQARH